MPEKKRQLPIWIGEIDDETRNFIIEQLTVDERLLVLVIAAEQKNQGLSIFPADVIPSFSLNTRELAKALIKATQD